VPNTKTIFLHFEYFPEDRLELDTEAGIASNIEGALKLPVIIKSANTTEIIALFKNIFDTFWSDLPNKDIKLSALLNLLLFELSIINHKPHQFNDELVNQALCIIKESTQKFFLLDELSEKLHVSSRSITQRFKICTGTTVHQYQIDLKLQMAYLVITHEKHKSFKEIAINFGFYDEFHFSKLFKKKYGFSPSKLNAH
jgi:AraC-like DNA-binding protein